MAKQKKTMITEEELDLILEIVHSNMSDFEKTLKLEEIISYKDLIDYVSNRKINSLCISDKLVRVFNIYKNYKNIGLFKDLYKCNLEELQNRLDNINVIYKTFKSDVSDDEKLKVIFNYYKDIDDFKKKYVLLIKFGSYDPRLDFAREALNDFQFITDKLNSFSDKEIQNIKYQKEIERILEENNYLDNYLYAEYVIKTYISDDKSYLKNKFLNNFGINDDILKYCEELVSFLNPCLYKEYQDAVSENNKKRGLYIGLTIKNLVNGINTGYLMDGTEFNLLEFYKRVPFKESGTKFVNTLKDFIKRNYEYDSGIYSTINNYMYENKIQKMAFVNEKNLIETSISYKGVKLTPEIIHNVFRYMRVNDLPKVTYVYHIILEKYLNNEIDFNLLDEQEYQREIQKNNSIYNNPYTLVLNKKN